MASIHDRELLEAVWEALNVARDNKALAIVRQGTIVNINALAAQLCERSSNELIGKSLADLLDGVSPPRSRANERWETALKTASGRPIAVEVTRQPLGSRLEDFDVYAIRDLRQRHAAAEQLQRQSELLLQHEEDLKAQNAKLDAALSNMFQGLAMFDAEQRVVIANDRFAEMYGQSPEEVRPGTPLRKIIEQRIASGHYVGTTADEVLESHARARGAAKGQPYDRAHGRRANDCRVHQTAARWRLGHDPSGHHGAGKAHRAARAAKPALEAARDRVGGAERPLRGRHQQHDAGSVSLFDADRRVVIANRRYAEIYGLTP